MEYRLLLGCLVFAVTWGPVSGTPSIHKITHERLFAPIPRSATSSGNPVVTVSNQSELIAALVNGNRIIMSNDIYLVDGGTIYNVPSGISIQGKTGLTIDGNGFKLDGNATVRCLTVGSQSDVTLINLNITGGYSVRIVVHLTVDCRLLIDNSRL